MLARGAARSRTGCARCGTPQRKTLLHAGRASGRATRPGRSAAITTAGGCRRPTTATPRPARPVRVAPSGVPWRRLPARLISPNLVGRDVRGVRARRADRRPTDPGDGRGTSWRAGRPRCMRWPTRRDPPRPLVTALPQRVLSRVDLARRHGTRRGRDRARVRRARHRAARALSADAGRWADDYLRSRHRRHLQPVRHERARARRPGARDGLGARLAVDAAQL